MDSDDFPSQPSLCVWGAVHSSKCSRVRKSRYREFADTPQTSCAVSQTRRLGLPPDCQMEVSGINPTHTPKEEDCHPSGRERSGSSSFVVSVPTSQQEKSTPFPRDWFNRNRWGFPQKCDLYITATICRSPPTPKPTEGERQCNEPH
eukprot:TRINITY_DN67732_c7_g6_i1.p1 TRINITY_DN67732_c7_g6~~TRINITY_DN67732_c7_g6_i1.p1  ORF type:complete len:147 (+),score=3.76 TRINITY_DN67732_c7_g6_i1:179-619(+)